jgi:murein L,D-transpeptidase YafK
MVLNMRRIHDQQVGRLCLILILAYFILCGTIAQARAAAPVDDQADHILIIKSKRSMILMRGNKVLKTYSVALGTVPIGAKEKQGDHKTPEGNYVIDAKNSYSRFHLALHISYPKEEDKKRARKMRVNPGGDIMIHGLESRFAFLGALHRQTDWTDGCIAVTNPEIEEIWKLVPIGTTVEIRP